MAIHPLRQIGLKLVSLCLAVLLWWIVAREPTVERNLRVPLQFQNISESLQIVGEPPSGIDVRVRGSSGTLARLQPGDIVAVLDLASARPGFRMFNVFKEHVRAPFGVSVEQVLTPTVPLELERLVVLAVPIMPSIEGDPAAGFAVGTVTSDPPTVEILVPEQRQPSVIDATTEPVSVEGATDTVQAVVAIGITDSTVQLREARTALVTVEIEPGPLERVIQDVPVIAMNAGAGLDVSLEPTTVSVLVRGPLDPLERLTIDAVIASVDLTGLTAGEHRLPVMVAPLEDLEVGESEPVGVLVTIR